MIKLKALSKAFLALACLCFYSAYNPALAQEKDAYQDPATTQPVEPKYVYSPDNPFATSEYTDIANLAELLIKQGYNVDNYFYSEGFTTGIDGTLGNENVCFRDDTNKVYIGRSDVCRDRQMDETYSYIQIDKMDWTNGFPDITVLQTGDLLGDDYTNWTGCYEYNAGWNGTTGGSCPSLQTSGQIIFGYIEQTLTNLAAIDLALQDAGIETTGYNYSWMIKNWDTNYTNQGNGRSTPDPIQVTVTIKDPNNNTVYSKTYDYSYYMDWTTFSGEEVFDEPINGEQISALELSVTGKDLGYWAGHYGPEFMNPSIKLNYRTTGAQDTTVEDALFNSMCTSDPLYDPSCPGYNDAMMAQINSSNSIETMTSTEPTLTTTDTIGTNPVADVTGATDITGTTTSTITDNTSTGTTDPVAEATGIPDPVAEATESIAEATESIAEATEEVASSEPSAAAEQKSSGLNANQLNTLNAASAVANSAVGSASDAASASAGVGLDANGGVGAALTSVDPTGSTTAMGEMTGSQDMGSTGTGDSTGTALAQDGSATAGSFDNPGIDNEGNNGLDAQSTGYIDSAGIGNVTGGSSIAGSTQTEDPNNMRESTSDGFDVSNVEQSVVNQSAEQAELATAELESSVDTTATDNALDAAETSAQASFTQTFTPGNPIDDIIKEMTAALIQKAVADTEEVAEKSSEESIQDQNAKEDKLVEAAQNGSDDEDAQAALLGYNPKIRAYQQPQMPGGDIYSSQGVYENQKTYDNPNARFFNGASDAKHQEMVRSQYEK